MIFSILKAIQIFFGIIFIFTGVLGLILSPSFISIGFLLFGISLIPFFLDKIIEKSNYKVDKTKKTYIRIGLFFVLIFSPSLDEENTVNNIEGVSNQPSITAILEREEKNFNDSIKIKSYIKNCINELTENEYEALLEEKLEKQFLDDEKLNKIILKEVQKFVKSQKDFSSEKEYLAYRAERAYSIADLEAFEKHLTDAMKKNGEYHINERLFESLINIKKQLRDGKGGIIACKMALKNGSQNAEITEQLADFYTKEEMYSKAIKYYNEYLKTNASKAATHTKIGIAYQNSRNESKAKIHYKKAIEIEGKGGQACELLRELTVKIVSYRYYSECCDGTTSSSTGRGACSHHRGVCRTIKEPITGYTMDCD